MGPRIVHWGTPDLTWVHEEKVQRTNTRCWRFFQYVSEPLQQNFMEPESGYYTLVKKNPPLPPSSSKEKLNLPN